MLAEMMLELGVVQRLWDKAFARQCEAARRIRAALLLSVTGLGSRYFVLLLHNFPKKLHSIVAFLAAIISSGGKYW